MSAYEINVVHAVVWKCASYQSGKSNFVVAYSGGIYNRVTLQVIQFIQLLQFGHMLGLQLDSHSFSTNGSKIIILLYFTMFVLGFKTVKKPRSFS